MTTATPGDASLREITVQGHRFGARVAPGTDGTWRATVVSYTFGAGARSLTRDLSSPLGIFETHWSETGPDAEAAFAALEERVRIRTRRSQSALSGAHGSSPATLGGVIAHIGVSPRDRTDD